MKPKNSFSDNGVKEYQLKVLKEENERLRKELYRYKKTFEEYEIEGLDTMSDVEFICLQEISKLREIAKTNCNLSEEEVKKLDTLHKNLRQCRNDKTKKKKNDEKVNDIDELLKIAKGK